MPFFLRKLKTFPRVLYYLVKSGRARNDYEGQWNSYWSSVEETGSSGEVLWDTGEYGEFTEKFESMIVESMDLTLPVLDLGCGNGSWSHLLARHFTRVVGIDVSEAAIALARSRSSHVDNVEFRVGNLVHPEVARSLVSDFGDMNIFMRGVFHVIRKSDRAAFVDNLARLLGERGVLYQIETDGQVLDYMLARPEDTGTGLPRQMHKVIEHGILPQGFGPKDEQLWYATERWQILHSEEAHLHTVQLPDGKDGRVPAYALMVRLRH